MEKDIIFLILQYNNVNITISCIHSIMRLEKQARVRIVVIDNCSIDAAGIRLAEYMRTGCQETGIAENSSENQIFLFKHEKGCEIDIVCRPVNDGFSKGNNFGFRYIKRRYSPKFLIVANSDVEFVQSNLIAQIEEEYEKNRFDILGPDIWAPYKELHQNPLALRTPTRKEVNRTIFFNQAGLIFFPILYPLLREMMKRNHGLAVSYDVAAEDICLQGACLIYSSGYIVFREQKSQGGGEDQALIGDTLFYPETGFYYEEFLQTLWCRKNGCKTVYAPNIKVNHLEGQSMDSISASERIRVKFRIQNILKSAKIYKMELLKNEKNASC